MLTATDYMTTDRWATLTARIGRKASHGSAHAPNPDEAWRMSGALDVTKIGTRLAALSRAHLLAGTVLDYGAGAGRLTPWLTETAREVINVDCSPGSGGGCWWAREPATLPPDWRGTIDLAVVLHVLYSVTPPSVATILEQLDAMLAPGGVIVADIPWTTGPAQWDDPAPDDLPGGWWVHDVGAVGALKDRVLRIPPPLDPPFAWEQLATPALWVFGR